MKKIILLLFASIFCLTFTGNAQVKVGDNPTSIDARSLLELESTTKAFYLPRLSTAQAAAQTGWKAGMVIYNTTQNCVQYYDGTAWFCFTAFISVDNDKDSTNEYNTSFGLNAGGDSLIITDQGTRYAVSAGDIMDTASLSNRINTNMQAIVDSSTNIRSDLADTSAIIRNLIAMREAMIRSALVDSAAAIRTTLDAHILADEDTDSTNEIQLLSISNDTLYLSDGNNVYLGSISSDNDQDSSNEYNTAFEMNAGGDSLIITDAGTRYAVSAGDILDTTSLSNRINTITQANIDSSAVLRTFIAVREAAIKSALVDTAAAIRTTLDAHILADEDLDSMNELQMLSISNDTLYLSDGNNVYLGAISSDNDQDSTNEYNTAFEMNAGGDSLIITDAGTRYAVSAGDILDTTSLSNRINVNMQAITDSSTNIRSDLADTSALIRTLITMREAAIRSALVDTAAAIRTTLDAHILADEDTDSTNEIQLLSISNDTLYLSDGNNVYLGAISSDNDQDSTNEYNTAFEMNAGGDSLIITDAGTRYAVSAGDILDTTSLSNRINTNTQANIDSSAVLRTFIAVREAAIRSALVDTAAAIRTTLDAHILADEDLDSMNELQLLSISNDTLYLSDGNSVYLGAISSDNDQDSTNEYNTAFEMNAGGDSLIITDAGTRYAVSAGDVLDTTSLSNRINTNTQANIDSSGVLRTFIAVREAAIRSALVDTAAAIRTDLNAHILTDEDLDSLNELQLLSISNDTLYLSDGNSVYLGAISSDNDQDSTNEYNTAFEMNAGGDSLIITDAGTRYAVSAGDVLDTTSLSNRINTNTQANIDSSGVLRTFIAVREAAIRSALVDTAAAIRTTLDTHITADEDLDSINELQMLSISNDTLYLSDGNNVYLGAISSDNDQDSTNEYNTAFEMNAGGDSLIITDAGTRYAVSAGDVLDTTSLSNRINTNTQANIDSSGVLRTFIAVKEAAIRSALVDTAAAIRTTLDAHITADEDLDSLNERISSVTFTQDTLTIIENDSTFKIYIEDTDTTNELIDSVTFINDTISIYEGDSTFTVVIKHIPTYLCKVESGIKISYKLKEVDNIYINEIDTSLKFTHQQLIDSGYTTCASGGSSFELTDCKRREIMSDNSSVIVYFNDSADVYSTAGVRTSYASYSTWLSGSGLTVTTVLNCFDERCLQIGNVQYKDNNGDNMYANIDNSADVRSYSTLIGQSAVACTPINCQQVYGPSDFGLNGSGLPANNPACTDLSATWFDGSTGELFSWDVTGVTWVKQPSVNSVSCPQASIAASGTINSSIGVTSVSKTGTGRYKVNLAVPQSNTNYVILLSKEEGLSTRDDVNIDVIEGSKSTNSFEVLISEGDNGTTANVYRDRNWYFNIPCSENFSTGIDSISVANDTLKISEGDTTFNITLIDQDTTNEKIDTMFILGDSIAIVEGSDTFFVDCSDKDWKLNKTGSASGLQGIPGGSAASGDYSIAGGLGNAASGYSSISLGGSANSASEIASVNIGGSSNTVSGRQALNISGSGNTVSGFWGSNIGGIGNTTLGDYASILGGTNNTAYSYGETVLGFNVKSYTPGSAIAIDTTDRLFVIGNGASSSARSNALTLLKDGRLGLGVDGNSAQTATLHIKPSTSINPLRVEDLQDSIASTNKIIMAAADGTIYTAPIDSIFTPGIGTINSVLTTTTQAISGQTLDTADALQFNYLSGRKYRFKVYIVYRSSNTNNGIRLAMNPISGNVWYKMNTPVNANGSNDLFSGFNSTITHVGGGSPSTIRDLVTTLEGTIHTTSSGTFSFQFAAETGGGTITIQANSLLEFELID